MEVHFLASTGAEHGEECAVASLNMQLLGGRRCVCRVCEPVCTAIADPFQSPAYFLNHIRSLFGLFKPGFSHFRVFGGYGRQKIAGESFI